jgi:uncharacterized membrane protein YjfL (UPF0719 family)
MAKTESKTGLVKHAGNRQAHLVLAVVFIGLAYAFASLAINSGSLLEYLAAIVFFAQAVRLIAGVFRNIRNR